MRRFFNKALWLFVHKIPWKPILIWGPWVLILLVLAFYGIENWRGQRALDRVVAQAERNGISLDWKDYNPASINEEENLITHPAFDDANDDILRSTNVLMKVGRAPKGISTNRRDFRKPRDLPLLTSRIDLRLWLDPSIRPTTEKEAAQKLDEIRKQRRALLDDFFATQQIKSLWLSSRPEDHFAPNENDSTSTLIKLLGVSQALAEDATLACALDGDRTCSQSLGKQSTTALFPSNPISAQKTNRSFCPKL